MTPEIAILILCLNEQEAIGAVVSAFKAHVPESASFVYDTASTDLTLSAPAEAVRLSEASR